jgi:HYR domain-containing protein
MNRLPLRKTRAASALLRAGISPIVLIVIVAALSSFQEARGSTHFFPVPAGGDFQAALDAAVPGDVIILEAGATFTGTFVLPVKTGDGWIVVRTSACDSDLPQSPGHRIDPSFAAFLPKLVAPDAQPAIRATPGAHHFWFLGVEVRPAPGTFSFNLIELGVNETSEADLPHHLIFDRCYIHGDPVQGTRRGIAMNGKWMAVIDSYLADFKEQGNDSQAVAGWNGLGPFAIANNYLEGAGDNVLFGGVDPTVPNLVPSDIEIRRNHFTKPLSWRIGDPSYAGTPWTVKNLFELKNAQRVLIDGNIFEHNWPDAQNGFSILFTVRDQDGTAPWSVVQDVTFTHNIVRHVASAVNLLGQDNNYPSQQTKRVLIKDNLFDDVNSTNWGGDGRLFQVLNGTASVTIDHNTAFQTGDIIAADGSPNTDFLYTNNLTPHNQYGVGGSGTYGDPMLTLSTYFPGYVFARNVLQGGNAATYPPDNFFPPTMADVLFVDQAGGNYRLQPTSPYKNAGSDGHDVGLDLDAVQSATSGVETGINAGFTLDDLWRMGFFPQDQPVPTNNPPVAMCKNITLSVDNSCMTGSITANDVDNGSFDPDSGDSITRAIDSTGPFNLGSYHVILTVTDSRGASSCCTATVTVVDSTPPTITAPPAVTAATGPGTAACGVTISDATLGTASATDGCSAPATITREPSGNFFTVGTTVITYTATDTSGNKATATQQVTVVDNTPPIISCPNPITVDFTSAAGAAVTFSVPASDNCGSATVTSAPASGSTFPLGTTTVTSTAVDPAGNTASCSFQATVLGPLGVKQNVLDQLVALLPTVTGENQTKLSDAIEEITDSLKPALWIDETHLQPGKGGDVFEEEEDAVEKLGELQGVAGSQGFIDRIVKADRLLADVAINVAIAAQGDPKAIAKAQEKLARGDSDIAAGKFENGIERYREAWKWANKAVGN